MAVCLSQLYHEHKRGVQAGYAKFETFPIWNIPLKHPVNVAYEAATADLNDVNMIDPFHLEAYAKTTVNYNRDIEIFPVLNTMFELILGESPYKSPTDMGVNMAGNCIIDDEAVCEAANQEIIRRYYAALCNQTKGVDRSDEAYKIGLLIKQSKLITNDRAVIAPALKKAEETGAPAAAIELSDGKIITGKTTNLLGACSAMLLNALKSLAEIPENVDIIDAAVIAPIQKLKVDSFGSANPRLHTDEILIALSMSAVTNPSARLAMEQLPKLRDTEAHATVILSDIDTSHRPLLKDGAD